MLHLAVCRQICVRHLKFRSRDVVGSFSFYHSWTERPPRKRRKRYRHCVSVSFLPRVMQLVSLKSNSTIRFVIDLLYNKLYNKSTKNPRQIYNKSKAVQQIHNKSTTNLASTTNPQQIEAMEFSYDLLWICCSVAANHGRGLRSQSAR